MSGSIRWIDKNEVIGQCDIALRGVEAKKKEMWNAEKEGLRKRLQQFRLKKSKRGIFRWFPKPYSEPTDSELEAIMRDSRHPAWLDRTGCPHWELYRGHLQPFRNTVSTAWNIMQLAEAEYGAKAVGITAEDWRLIQIGVDMHATLQKKF